MTQRPNRTLFRNANLIMPRINRFVLNLASSVLLLASSVPLVQAGSFSTDFSSTPANTTLLGNATVTAGALHLTEAAGTQTGSLLINDFSSGAAISAFVADFKVELGGG